MVIAVSIQAQNGLGEREDSLSDEQLVTFEKVRHWEADQARQVYMAN